MQLDMGWKDKESKKLIDISGDGNSTNGHMDDSRCTFSSVDILGILIF